MKKWIAMLLAVLTAVSLTACAAKSDLESANARVFSSAER